MKLIADCGLRIADFKTTNPKFAGAVRTVFWIILLTTHYSLLTGVAWACPLCSEALFSPAETAAQRGLIQGYAVSIATLIATPLILIGSVVTLVIRSSRHSK